MKDDMKIEMEAGRNIQLDHIKEIMKENIPELLAENQRLKEQLDREIHINRIMLNAINFYANKNFWYDRDDESGWEVAQQTLKQIEEME